MGAPPINPADAMRTLNAIRDLVEEVPMETGPWPELLFKHRGVQPPSALYVTQDDFLRVSVFTTTSTSGLTLGLRIMGADGQVRREEESLDGVSVSTLTTKTFGLREGFLLGVAVSNLGGGLADGACFVSVGLQFGSGTRAPYQILAQDYVTNLFSVEWPAAAVRTQPTSTKAARPLSIQITNPAAGAELTYTVPANKYYLLKSTYFTLVSSAVAGSRAPLIVIDDGSHRVFRGDTQFVQAPSTTVAYGGGSGIIDPTTNANANCAMVPLPTDIVLGPGWRFLTQTLNLDVGDQYQGASLAVLDQS